MARGLRHRFIGLRWQNIGFDQGVAGSVVFAAHNGRGIASRARDDDGRLDGVGRSEAAGLNLGLLRVLPVVVGGDEGAIDIAQLQSWIRQHVGNSKLC